MRLRATVVLIVAWSLWDPVAEAQTVAAVPGPCQDGVLPGGALSRVCVPASGWNGDVLIWAHGYVAFNAPIDFYHLELGGIDLPTLMQSLGFAFATTSYRQNGLAILEGVEDVRELTATVAAVMPAPPNRTFLAGASVGALIAALLAERSPELFSGVLSACGPVGSFRGQVDYIDDFRALFDVYFPGVIPGSAVAIPPDVIAEWETTYRPAVDAAMRAFPARALELMRVARAAYDPSDFNTVVETAVNVLWYNVFGTNDAQDKLGGNPYDNTHRWYSGSSSDWLLNVLAQRYAAAPAALAAMAPYETIGRPGVSMVMLHTVGDEVVPYRHELAYWWKVAANGIQPPPVWPVPRYGHCAFTAEEAVAAFLYVVLSSMP